MLNETYSMIFKHCALYESTAQCLKITEKVAFNIGSEVLPDRSLLIGQKLVKNAKIKKLNMGQFE